MDSNRTYNGSSWTSDENRRFELGVQIYPDGCVNRWEKIATLVPGKSTEAIKQHYKFLRKDIDAIDSDRIPLPEEKISSTNSLHIDKPEQLEEQGRKGEQSEDRGKKGIWSPEEHRLFLAGLHKYGRGEWRTISRNYVQSRTPSQVASHAQKYFRRLSTREKRRPSIHDINTIGQAADGSTPLEPITGKKKSEADGGSSSKCRWKEPPPMSVEELMNFVPPCIVESSDFNFVPTPGLPLPTPPPPPPPPGCSSSSPGKMVYGFDDQTPAQLIPNDQMYNMASMDFLEPGFSDRMF